MQTSYKPFLDLFCETVYAAVQAQKIHYKSLKKQQQQIQDILLHAVVLHNIALIVLLILIA